LAWGITNVGRDRPLDSPLVVLGYTVSLFCIGFVARLSSFATCPVSSGQSGYGIISEGHIAGY
jgi:hypothetical protein